MANNDLVYVLPGIMGSTLAHDGRMIWAPSKGAVLEAVTTLGRALDRMRLPEGIGCGEPNDGITAISLMPDIHLIPGLWTPMFGYDELLARLRQVERAGKVGGVFPFPYDWRLSNRFNAGVLAGEVERRLDSWRDSHPSRIDAKVVFICHSMGGLIARWYIEKLGGHELTRQLVTIGTPYRGAAKAADQLVNGIRKDLGLFAVDLTETIRSFPSVYELLPSYACCESNGTLARISEVSLPNLSANLVNDAVEFNEELKLAEAGRSASLDTTHAIVGIRQPSPTSFRIVNQGLEMLDTIEGDNEFGDATVPLVGSLGHDLAADTNRIRRVVCRHGALQRNAAVLDEIESIITARNVRRRGDQVVLSVELPELLILGECLTVTVDYDPSDVRQPSVQVALIPESGTDSSAARAEVRQPRIRDMRATASFRPSAPGAYRIVVSSTAPGIVSPIEGTTLVWHST